MFRHEAIFGFAIASIMAGCAATPTASVPEAGRDQPVIVTQSGDDTDDNEGYLGGATPEEIVKCRKVESLGSRLSKTVCGPQKNDSILFGVIDAGGTREPQ